MNNRVIDGINDIRERHFCYESMFLQIFSEKNEKNSDLCQY